MLATLVGCCRDWDETNTDLAAALSQLPLLRCLELCHSNFGDTSLCAVSSLTHLQALVLENLSKAGAAVYAALPASLTRLDLVSTKRGLAMTGSSCSHLAALSQLLHLKLQQIRGVELTALATLSQLTHLHLQGSKKEADQPLQPLMAVVAGLQQLLHLHLSVTNYAPSDLTVEPLTQWAALVAITQLTYLHYDGTAWQHGKSSGLRAGKLCRTVWHWLQMLLALHAACTMVLATWFTVLHAAGTVVLATLFTLLHAS
jgi:hypothetical protein